MKHMNKVKRIAALGLAGLLSCGAFACTPPPAGGNSSSGGATIGGGTSSGGSSGSAKGKTELKIKVFNGGLGYQWILELANNFMEKFKDVSFEEGKKGVFIALTPNKEFSNLASNMAVGADAEDIYYTSDCNFYNFMDVDVAYDVTDIMTADVYNEDGEVELNDTGDGWATQSDSIADRITVEHTANRLKVEVEGELEPHYFALPFDDSTAGIIVDWDLFKKKGWTNYNGIDGMPATWAELKDLLGKIRKEGYSAFTFSTGVQYTRVIQAAVQAQVDGLETYYDLFSDYTGKYDFNGDGDTDDAGEIITPNTAYKLMDTRGYKAAVEMAATMFEKTSAGKTYYDAGATTGLSFGAAQQDFVMSIETKKPIAMLLEGEWWENEARATFNAMGDVNPEYGYGQREFRMMPIPSFDSTNEDQKYTLGAWTGGAVTIVNKKTVDGNAAKEKVAELWLQYQYSTEGLKCFSRHSGATLPMEYDMDDKELEALTPFARNLFKLRRDPRVQTVYNGVSLQNETVRRAAAQLSYATKLNNTNYTGTLFQIALKMSKAGTKWTVAEYIEGMHTYQDNTIKAAFPAK